MKEESLIKAQEKLLEALRDLDIDLMDKMDLVVNVTRFLDADKYQENIKTLIIHEIEEKNRRRNI